MERVSITTRTTAESLDRTLQWGKNQIRSQQQWSRSLDAERRPRKRARTKKAVDSGSGLPTSRLAPRQTIDSTPVSGLENRHDNPEPTPTFVPRDGIVTDSVLAPSVAKQTDSALFTGATLAASLQVNVPTGAPTSATASVVVVTASASATAAPSSGMSVTTEAIIISCSIAGALVLITLVCLLSVCYRKRRRRNLDEVALKGMPRRMQSSSTMRSDGWRSDTSEPEKQSLISASRSRSVSPASRGASPSAPVPAQQKSLGGYKPFMDTIPESPQPPSPTSIYTKKSPPQPTAPGQLQLEFSNMQVEESLHSPLKPPPLRIRQGQEGTNSSAANSTLLPSPKNRFSAVRLPFMSGTTTGNRRSSAGQSLASSYDEERATANYRRTMDSETLPAPVGPGSRYRDSFWSVAASSIMKPDRFKSGYGDSVYAPSSSDLRHTRTNSASSGGYARTASSGVGVGVDDAGPAAIHSRTRSHSSLYSQRRPSQALIPALPPMPSRFDNSQSHKSGLQNQSVTSVGSQGSGPPGDIELKGRLHSVDFWAREERDMRLGTFAPAELDGSGSGHPTPIIEVPTPLSMSTPRDSKGAVIGAAMDSTPRSSNPYFANAAIGMQGGYSAAVQGADGPIRESSLMPQGYSHEHADDGRKLWNRGRSAERDARQSSSEVAHPGDFVMI